MTTTATITNTDTTTTTEIDEDSVDFLFAKIEELKALTTWFNKTGKQLIKKHTKARRNKTPSSSNRGKSGFCVPVQLDKSLAKFLGVDPNEQMVRTDVTKAITAYIKEKNLQVQENKKHFICDDALAKIFNVPPKTQTNWFEMQKFLSKLLTSVKKDEVPEKEAEKQPSDSGAPVAKRIKKA